MLETQAANDALKLHLISLFAHSVRPAPVAWLAHRETRQIAGILHDVMAHEMFAKCPDEIKLARMGSLEQSLADESKSHRRPSEMTAISEDQVKQFMTTARRAASTLTDNSVAATPPHPTKSLPSPSLGTSDDDGEGVELGHTSTSLTVSAESIHCEMPGAASMPQQQPEEEHVPQATSRGTAEYESSGMVDSRRRRMSLTASTCPVESTTSDAPPPTDEHSVTWDITAGPALPDPSEGKQDDSTDPPPLMACDPHEVTSNPSMVPSDEGVREVTAGDFYVVDSNPSPVAAHVVVDGGADQSYEALPPPVDDWTSQDMPSVDASTWRHSTDRADGYDSTLIDGATDDEPCQGADGTLLVRDKRRVIFRA
ncbi:hypothetical protein DYB32_004105 [Aphanomyces invadans]|uniref:Uncharacterized protein n=1 Tax=Aphanomyces invadans TaxID=157072 RepID=A0A3R6ZRG6_9STRA|nr:hypothetical protein DYB32_004105 [Aphanomyces invadans]